MGDNNDDSSPLDCRLLLVEDNDDHRSLVSRILRKVGCRVTIAENGRIAIELAQAARDEGRPFEIILMDVQMPELDGLATTRLLRSAGVTSPIIAVTARAMTTNQEECLQAGCDDFIPKPFDRTKLVGLVRNHLQNASSPT